MLLAVVIAGIGYTLFARDGVAAELVRVVAMLSGILVAVAGGGTPDARLDRPDVHARFRRTLKWTGFFAAVFFLGGLLAEVAVARGSGLGFSIPGPALLIPALLAGYFLSLAVHEGGHLVGGRLAGFGFSFLRIGPLAIFRGERLRVRIIPGRGLLGGMAASAPQDAHRLRRRTLAMVAGGPVASLALGLAGASWLSASGDGGVLGVICGVSLFVGAVSAIPYRKGLLMSDGARALVLLRGGREEAERMCANLALTGASVGGERPGEWDPGLVERAVALPDGSQEDALGAALAYFHALDKGDLKRAKELLGRALSAVERPDSVGKGLLGMRAQVLLEAAFFEARFGDDSKAARLDLERAQAESQTMKLAGLRQVGLRSEAAVLLAEGSYGEAAERASEALDATEHLFSPGASGFEQDQLREILRLAGHGHAARGEPKRKTGKALQAVTSAPTVKLLTLGLGRLRYVVRWVSGKRGLEEGEFGYHRHSPMRSLVWVMLLVAPVEVLVFELLVPYAWLRWAILVLSIYGLLWTCGLAASLVALPHRTEGFGVRLRYGDTVEGLIPYSQIAEINLNKQRAPARGEGLKEVPAENAAYLTVGGKTDVSLSLRAPQVISGPLRPSSPVRKVHVAADEPERMMRELKRRVGEKDAGSPHSGKFRPARRGI